MRRVLVVIPLLLTLALPVGAARAAGSVPVPEEDPFYAMPTDVASYAPGQVIASRQISASAFSVPLPAKAWQLKYRTTDSKGRPSATVTTVLVPLLPWTGKGPRPLVSYQTAEDGVAGKCAPSYSLRAGAAGGFTNATGEVSIMALALLNGWALSVPDYEGPQSQFLVAKTEAYGVLDGLRAARAFAPAGIDPKAPLAMWGYSGGSFATSVAAQYQGEYAPELGIRSIVLGGYVANVRSVIDAFSGSAVGGAIPMGMHGFDRAYPELSIPSYLNDRGKQLFAATEEDCINDAVVRAPFLKIQDIEALPGALDRPEIEAMLSSNSPITIPGLPDSAVYHYHAVADELAPIGPARETLKQWCAAGVVVTNQEDLVGEHLSEVATGVPGALAYLKSSFAGTAPRNDCARIP